MEVRRVAQGAGTTLGWPAGPSVRDRDHDATDPAHADVPAQLRHGRLLLFEQDGEAYLRAAGSWDDMPITLETAYRRAGRHAQQAFWGDEYPTSSMLHQIALHAAS